MANSDFAACVGHQQTKLAKLSLGLAIWLAGHCPEIINVNKAITNGSEGALGSGKKFCVKCPLSAII